MIRLLLNKRCRFGHTSRDCTAPKVTFGPFTFLGGLANDFAITRTGPRSNATTAARWGTLSSVARNQSMKRQMKMESLEAKLAAEAGSSPL